MKPHYRLRVLDMDGYLFWWTEKTTTNRGRRCVRNFGATCFTSAEAIRRAPR